MAKDKASTSERTYLGYASALYPAEGAAPVRPGDTVALTDDQYRALTAAGHSFDPPWTGSVAPAPDEVPDVPGEVPAQTNV